MADKKRILVLSPHPDDESIGCGGTLLHHVKEGDTVHIVFLTSGENGGHGLSALETIRVREAESCAAAEILGVKHLEFWRLPDGNVRATHGPVERLRNKLNQFMPDRVYVPHEGEMHADHRGTARLIRRALQGLKEIRPLVWMYEIWTPTQRLDAIIDISEFMNLKLRAVRAYRSQCSEVDFVEAVRGLNRYRGEMHSWPGGDFAEAFTRMKL